MDTVSTIDLLDDPATLETDMKAVHDFAFKGIALDPDVRARVRARAERIQDKTRLKFGNVDIQQLLPPVTFQE